jgi:septum formation protein
MTLRPPLVLASASPRRRELLQSIGLPHEVVPSGVAEPAPGTMSPANLVREASRRKALDVASRMPGRLVLGADTIVLLDGPAPEVLCKPDDRAGAERMLRKLSGRTHRVLTSVVLVAAEAPLRVAHAASETDVSFRELPDALIRRYATTGEPMDKAGAYAAQGLVSTHLRAVRGSWTNVVGLPLELLPDLFAELGLELSDWQSW